MNPVVLAMPLAYNPAFHQLFLIAKPVRRIVNQLERAKPLRYPLQIAEESLESSEILPPAYAKDLGAVLRSIPFCLPSR
jgi:hypothetical protein